jgi:hypothetical protein
MAGADADSGEASVKAGKDSVVGSAAEGVGEKTRAHAAAMVRAQPYSGARRPARTRAAWPPPITELRLHHAVAELLNWILLSPSTAWTTFPSGWSEMKKGAAGRLKGCGLVAGMPDIFIFHEGRAIGLELKARKGVLSKAQRETHGRLRKAGVEVHVCRNLDEIQPILKREQIPFRPLELT